MMEDTTKNVSKLKVYIHKEMRAEWRHIGRNTQRGELNKLDTKGNKIKQRNEI